jgi:stage V sporulation protein G
MDITEVRVKLMEDSDDRLRAFCSVTFDDAFVVRDLKINDGTSGPFVAMPSRKLTCHCPKCGAKNHLRARYCNHCGAPQPQERAARDPEGRAKLYADIAHPINSACREMIQTRVIAEYREELQRAQEPGYASRYDDDYGDDDFDADFLPEPGPRATTKQIEPAESTPPPPHHPATQPTTVAAPKSRRDGFGAGIFDE